MNVDVGNICFHKNFWKLSKKVGNTEFEEESFLDLMAAASTIPPSGSHDLKLKVREMRLVQTEVKKPISMTSEDEWM